MKKGDKVLFNGTFITIDEADMLYMEYLATKEKIKKLYDYINSLKILLNGEKLVELYYEDARLLSDEWIVANCHAQELKETMEAEEKRVEEIAYKYARQANLQPMTRKKYETVKDGIKKALLHTDKEYLAAKTEYEQASKVVEQKRKKLDDYRLNDKENIKANKALVRAQIAEAYKEIDSLKNKTVEIIEKMDYIVYGEQKVKRR